MTDAGKRWGASPLCSEEMVDLTESRHKHAFIRNQEANQLIEEKTDYNHPQEGNRLRLGKVETSVAIAPLALRDHAALRAAFAGDASEGKARTAETSGWSKDRRLHRGRFPSFPQPIIAKTRLPPARITIGRASIRSADVKHDRWEAPP